MKSSFQRIVFIAACLMTVNGAAVDTGRPVFSRAVELVEKASKATGNINYNDFCQRKGVGTFKQGCQIKEMPNVGLLVCLQNFNFNGANTCDLTLERELNSLNTLVKAKLKVLPYHDKLIKGLKCAERGSADVSCSGYLVEWVAAEKGKEQHLRSHFRIGTTETLLKWLKGFQTTQEARSITRVDLEKILKFTKPDTGCIYTRICDLQGYFMKAGGFEIADPDEIKSGESLDYTCHTPDDYPKTRQVVEGLKKMVKELE